MQEDINEEKRKRRELQSEMDEAKRIVSKMTRQAEDRSQLDIHTMEKKDLENKIQFLWVKSYFSYYVGGRPRA